MPEHDKDIFGVDLFGVSLAPNNRGRLAERFTFPPFSVFDARSGDWQERKRAWLSLGIKSEIGRDGDLLYKNQMQLFQYYRMKEGETDKTTIAGTSVFDPVLTELCYQWFCPPGGQIVDPFAGGSVRGIVASMMGFKYWGCDLRAEQITANHQQAETILPAHDETILADVRPVWVCGDSSQMLDTAPEADLVFSCPPYGNLEKYSDDPLDLSTMDYDTFMTSLGVIIQKSCSRLKEGGMACFVVGDFRDKKTGFLRGFHADTILAFRSCGLRLYNDAILLTVAGTLPIRVSSSFEVGKKLGKTHQNVLVFKKGDNK